MDKEGSVIDEEDKQSRQEIGDILRKPSNDAAYELFSSGRERNLTNENEKSGLNRIKKPLSVVE